MNKKYTFYFQDQEIKLTKEEIVSRIEKLNPKWQSNVMNEIVRKFNSSPYNRSGFNLSYETSELIKHVDDLKQRLNKI